MKKRNQRGSTAVEIALSFLVLMPMVMGLSVVGVNLVRSLQVHQFCRDAAHMYAYGVDFAQPANQTLLANLAQGLNFQKTGGNGVMLFSTVTYVGPNDCTAAGLQANTTSCPNLNQAVFCRRIVVGNPSKMTSHYGTPNPAIIGSDGYISSANYLKDKSDRAAGFTDLMSLSTGQFAYLTETYMASSDVYWKNYMNSTGIYSYQIF